MEKPNTSNTSNFSEEQLTRYKEYGIMSMQCSAIFRQKLGNLLKADREKRGLSLEELSQEIYISLPKLQNIEQGKKQKSNIHQSTEITKYRARQKTKKLVYYQYFIKILQQGA